MPNIDYSECLSDLIKRGIDLLASRVPEEKRNLLKAKFENISGKTGKYFVPNTLFQQRTSRKNRTLIPFEHIKNNDISFEQLKTFKNGIVVEFVNNEFFEEYSKPEDERNNVFKELLPTMFESSKNIVAGIIDIRTTGTSDSNKQREALRNLSSFLIKEKLIDSNDQIETNEKSEVIKICENPGSSSLSKVFIQRNSEKYLGTGNDKWAGFVYYKISGGQKESYDSHKDNKISSDKVQLFNPSVEYASDKVLQDIDLVMIYFALFSIDLKKRDRDWYVTRILFENYFKTKTYLDIKLYDYVKEHVSLNIPENKNLLIDPIQVKRIEIIDFTLSDRNENSLDITHQDSVSQAKYHYDSEKQTLLTPALPTNLFWSKHLSNMMQQNFSLKDYFEEQRKNVKEWDRLKIDKYL